MERPDAYPGVRLHPTCLCRGLTILECLLATLVLAIIGVSMLFVLSSGRAGFVYSDQSLQGMRLGEHILDEIAARPYYGNGVARPSWCLDNYNAYTDGPGTLIDFLDTAYGAETQGFKRSVAVTTSTQTFPSLGGFSMPGKQVTIRMTPPSGDAYDLVRFVPERPVP